MHKNVQAKEFAQKTWQNKMHKNPNRKKKKA